VVLIEVPAPKLKWHQKGMSREYYSLAIYQYLNKYLYLGL